MFKLSSLFTFSFFTCVTSLSVPVRPAKSMEFQVLFIFQWQMIIFNFNFKMPMRDGTYLHTLIFFPHKEVSGEEIKLPAVVDRSPYGTTST